MSQEPSTDLPPGAETAPASARHPRRRLALALVVVASVLAFAAIFALWINRQVLDTENWTQASTEMLESPAVRDQTAKYLADQLYANVDVEAQLRSALPPRAEPLAGPLAGLLRDRVELRAREALARPGVQELWADANRRAHELLLRVLDGGGPIASTEGGVVVLDLKALLTETEQRAGIGGRAAEALPPAAAQITILESDQLDAAQDIARLLDTLAIVLVVLSLGLFGVALAIVPGDRRRIVRDIGIGLVVAGVAALATASLLGDLLVDALAKTAAVEPAVRDVYDVSTSLLEEAATATIAYGVVALLGAWLAGRTRWAVGVRRGLSPYLREPAFAYGGLAVIVAIVVLWWAPTPALRNPLTALILVALAALGLEGLRRQTAREFPEANREDAARRRRERIGAVTGSIGSRGRAGVGVAGGSTASEPPTAADDRPATPVG